MEKAAKGKELALEDRRRRRAEIDAIYALVNEVCRKATFKMEVSTDGPWKIDRWFAENVDAPHALCTFDPMCDTEDEEGALISINTRRIERELLQLGMVRSHPKWGVAVRLAEDSLLALVRKVLQIEFGGTAYREI